MWSQSARGGVESEAKAAKDQYLLLAQNDMQQGKAEEEKGIELIITVEILSNFFSR